MSKHKRIYRLEGINIDDIVLRHIELQKAGLFIRRNRSSINRINYTNDPDTDKTKSLLYQKYTYLIHIIINRIFESRQPHATLNAKVLQAVFGKDYKNMIVTLNVMDIVFSDGVYQPNEKSYGYWINPVYKITYTLESPQYLHIYFYKLNRILDDLNEERQKQLRQTLMDDKFFDNYNNALSRLKILYPADVKDFSTHSVFRNANSKAYFQHIVYKYQEGGHHITSVDKNGRIYSILTSTPRSLKYFLNIKFSADIHNSHPLLFNSILYSHYHISSSTINHLNLIFSKWRVVYSHYDRRNIRKGLISSGIEKGEIANIPNDILHYVYLTSMGEFWDCVLSQDICDAEGLLRGDIKVLMFAEVFYSKRLSTKGKKFAKIFQKQFPSVYKIVRKEKQTDRTKLANDMMKLESQLFREVLNSLYRKRFSVLSIHDAVVVLDIKGNTKCTEDVVTEVIQQVYLSHGLCPDVSIDNYGAEAEYNFMVEDQEYRENVTAYISDLIAQQEAGDTEVQYVLDQLELGNYEIVYTAMGDDLFLHKTKRDPNPLTNPGKRAL